VLYKDIGICRMQFRTQSFDRSIKYSEYFSTKNNDEETNTKYEEDYIGKHLDL
jgi:hypothetical protein